MTPTRINRAAAYPLVYAYVLGGYMITNHTGSWNPAHLLPLTAIDRATPFLPWTGWIYVTVFPFPLLAIRFVREERDIRSLLAAFVAVATLCFGVFMCYPTVYPRPPLDGAGPPAWPLMMVRFLDHATNCWPSMHVTSAFLTAFYVRRSRPELGAFLIFWAAAISVSTLTTKQHYFWDVAAGTALAAAAYAALRPSPAPAERTRGAGALSAE